MTESPEAENLRSGSRFEKPFELLGINTTGKSVSELYRELNFRAREEFKEHCYRSKKNYTRGQFSKTLFYKRYYFLRKHLNEITTWLYNGKEEMPKELKLIMKEKVDYSNPWGTGSAIVESRKNDFLGKI